MELFNRPRLRRSAFGLVPETPADRAARELEQQGAVKAHHDAHRLATRGNRARRRHPFAGVPGTRRLSPASAYRWALYLEMKHHRGETPITLAEAVEQKTAALTAAGWLS